MPEDKKDPVVDASFDLLTKVLPAVDALVGLRAKLVEGGFSNQAADAVVVTMFQLASQQQQEQSSGGQLMQLIEKFVKDRGTK